MESLLESRLHPSPEAKFETRIGSANLLLPRDEDIVELLRSSDFDSRLQTLNRMIFVSKRDPEWFSRFSKKGDLFKNIDRMLTEDRWEVQHQCIRFLIEGMPSFGSNLEYCMCYVLPNLIPKLGSSKITVRRVATQVIQSFLRTQPEALSTFLKMLSTYVQTSNERLTKLELLNELPSLLLDEVRGGNWLALVDGLTRTLSSADSDTTERATILLKKLQGFIGEVAMERFLAELNEEQRTEFNTKVRNLALSVESENNIDESSTSLAPPKSGERRFRFGIVPTYIASMLADEDTNTKLSAVEKLKSIIEKMNAEEQAKLLPHLHSFFVVLGNVLNDLNFKVVVLSLDVLRITINRLKGSIEAHLQQVMSLLSRQFGNQKSIAKQLVMLSCTDLFRHLNPKTVVAVLCVFLEHRNSRVREEVLNILTVALLSTPTGKMNLSAVANLLVPRLVDPKRRVRLAAFELLSSLAVQMNGKVEPIMKIVREFEKKDNEGLAAAVTSRLKRSSLPRIRYDGLLEYSTPPLTDSSFDVDESALLLPENLDLHWILYSNGTAKDDVSPTVFVAFKGGVKAALTQHNVLWETESDKDQWSNSFGSSGSRHEAEEDSAGKG